MPGWGSTRIDTDRRRNNGRESILTDEKQRDLWEAILGPEQDGALDGARSLRAERPFEAREIGGSPIAIQQGVAGGKEP